MSRSHFLQALTDAKLELTTLLESLGEKSFGEKTLETIKEQLAAIAPALEQLLNQKDERAKEFSDVQTQILKICGEIAGNSDRAGTQVVVDVSDLSLKKLDEFHEQLQELQKEKVTLYRILKEVHPSLNDGTEWIRRLKTIF